MRIRHQTFQNCLSMALCHPDLDLHTMLTYKDFLRSPQFKIQSHYDLGFYLANWGTLPALGARVFLGQNKPKRFLRRLEQ